jgi:IclR family KDG regulon transcriptional repressor
MPQAAGGGVRSVDKAVSIVEALAASPRGLGLAEIARAIGQNESTTHHLVATLRRRGFVEQDNTTRVYRLGHRLVQLAVSFLADTDLYSVAVGPLFTLRDQTGETSYLTALRGADTGTMIELPGWHPVQARRAPEVNAPSWHSTATGKLFLAYMSPERRHDLLDSMELRAFPTHTLCHRDALEREFETIRAQGYALDQQENFDGVACIAAPVFTLHGECNASASISFPATKLAQIPTMLPVVLVTADRISASLGYVQPADKQNLSLVAS